MIRVGIDVAQLSDKSLTGIPLYIEGLLREFLRDTDPATRQEEFVLFGSQTGTDLPALLRERKISTATIGAAGGFRCVPAADYRLDISFPGLASRTGIGSLVRKWDGRVAIPFGKWVTNRRIGEALDVFHHTSILRADTRVARKHIVTIYDLTSRFFPETHNRVNIYEWERVFSFAQNYADMVVTDSESARQDVIEHLKVPEDRVRAIPLGLRPLPVVGTAEVEAVRRKIGVPGGSGRFVFAVGSLEPRKNLPRLIEAFAGLIREPGLSDIKLVLTGARMHGAEQVDRAIRDHGLDNSVVRTGYVSDTDLAALLKACDVFVYPSLYEGFGLPVLEAMASGAPVVTSNVSSLPEVTGDAALLVDPMSSDEIADGIRRVLTDPMLSAELRRRGAERARLFTNANTADATRRLYHEVTGR